MENHDNKSQAVSQSKIVKVIVWVMVLSACIMLALVYKAIVKHKAGYAQMIATELVVVYYDHHKKFPQNWAQLKEYYPQVRHTGFLANFAAVEKAVMIDFDRLDAFLTMDTFRADEVESIVTLVKDKEAHFVGGEANILIVKYLTGIVTIADFIPAVEEE